MSPFQVQSWILSCVRRQLVDRGPFTSMLAACLKQSGRISVQNRNFALFYWIGGCSLCWWVVLHKYEVILVRLHGQDILLIQNPKAFVFRLPS